MTGIRYAGQGVQKYLLPSAFDVGHSSPCKTNGASQHLLSEVCSFPDLSDFFGDGFVKITVHVSHDVSLVTQPPTSVNIKHIMVMCS